MSNIIWFLACLIISGGLFGLVRLLGFKISFVSTFKSVATVAAISPLVMISALVVGTFGGAVFFLILWALEKVQIVSTVWLRTMPLWFFILGSIATGYILLFGSIWVGNWKDRRKQSVEAAEKPSDERSNRR